MYWENVKFLEKLIFLEVFFLLKKIRKLKKKILLEENENILNENISWRNIKFSNKFCLIFLVSKKYEKSEKKIFFKNMIKKFFEINL